MHDKFLHFAAAYPAHRRVTTARAQRLFLYALTRVPYAVMLHALEQHKRSEQWRQLIVPSMLTWLEEERWIQVLPEPAAEPPALSPITRSALNALRGSK